jgi:vacuolar-type H+-ATPase subunit H
MAKIVVKQKKTLRDHASTLADQAGSLSDTLSPHVRAVGDKAVPTIVAAAAAAGPALKDARDKAAPYVAGARDKAAPVVSSAREKAAPVVASALERTSPARDKAAPLVNEARDRFTSDVLPLLTAALTALDEATSDARAEARERGNALTKAFRTEVVPPPKRGLKARDLLVSAGLGGIVFAVVKKVTAGKQTTTAWQSSYTPPAPATGTHRAASGAEPGTDVGAADPTEAAADSAVTPHEATTPSRPATEVTVDVDPLDRP